MSEELVVLRSESNRARQQELLNFDSVPQVVCWWRYAKALHFVKQGGALQAKSGSCSSRTSELPISALASGEDFSSAPFL